MGRPVPRRPPVGGMLFVALLSGLAGLAGWGYGIFLLLNSWDLHDEATTTGIITDTNDPGVRALRSARATVVFEASGALFEFRAAPVVAALGSRSTGTRVDVVYDARNPDDALVDSPWDLWLFPGIVLLAGVILASSGLKLGARAVGARPIGTPPTGPAKLEVPVSPEPDVINLPDNPVITRWRDAPDWVADLNIFFDTRPEVKRAYLAETRPQEPEEPRVVFLAIELVGVEWGNWFPRYARRLQGPPGDPIMAVDASESHKLIDRIKKTKPFHAKA